MRRELSFLLLLHVLTLVILCHSHLIHVSLIKSNLVVHKYARTLKYKGLNVL